MPPRRRGGWGSGGLGRLTISAITYEKWYDYLKIGKTLHPTPCLHQQTFSAAPILIFGVLISSWKKVKLTVGEGVSPDEKIFTPTDERGFFPYTPHPLSSQRNVAKYTERSNQFVIYVAYKIG